tara:strand:- start:12 stop:434 length:423 start_codon:yes stop_codon:yes gene_type:complete
MPVEYLRNQRHQKIVAEIANDRLDYPDEKNPTLETFTNATTPRMAAGEIDGNPVYPDIVVVRRPGNWLQIIAQVETLDSITKEQALNIWKPYSLMGDLLLYVPTGCVQSTKSLCKQFDIQIKGLRTWRYRPVWGLTIVNI